MSELSNLSLDEKKTYVFKNGTPHQWIQCPICGTMKPLIVKKETATKDPKFLYYKDVDGVLQRRFKGPDDNYLPLHMRYMGGRLGSYTKIDESMTSDLLRRVDHDLFMDFQKSLNKASYFFK